MDWINKTWINKIKHGMIKHGLIKHGVKTVKLIQTLSPREELYTPVQRLTLVEKQLEFKIHCFKSNHDSSHRNSP